MADTFIRSMKSLGPLHDLLLRACPPDQDGIVSIPILAERLELSAFTIYKWIRNVKVPPGQAVKVVQLNNGFWDEARRKGQDVPEGVIVKLEDFHPYVYA